MDRKPSTGAIVIMASGALMLIGSFLDFFKVDFGFGSEGESAWGSGLFPIAIYPVLFGLIMAAHAAAVSFADVRLPDQPAGFSWKQLHLALAAFALLIMLGYLVVDKGGADLAIGFFLMFLAAIGLMVGAVMFSKEGVTPVAGTAPPTPF